MARESSYSSIILKKTPFGEADEIITALTFEQGKMRFLAKSVKLIKSKLMNNLQGLFLCNIRVAASKSGKLPKIIGAETVKTFPTLRQNLALLKPAFAAVELALKFLPDEQVHQAEFNLLKSFLENLDNKNISENHTETGLSAFKIKFLEILGLGIKYPKTYNGLHFEPSMGGFISESRGGVPVSGNSLENFLALKGTSFKDLPKKAENYTELKNLVDDFLEYQLERELRAEKSLKNVV